MTPTGCWTDISTPAVGSASKLRGVEAVAANDVWAVGYYDVSFPRYPTLVEHWDGTAWSMVSSPDPPSPGVFPAPRAPPIR